MTFSIGIIGGGFSGTLVAVNLIRYLTADQNTQITLLDKAGAFAQGVAYSTKDPAHLLNVRASNMGAFADNKGHFYQWLVDKENLWRPQFPNLSLDPKIFYPRMLYAHYIRAIFQEAQALAVQKKINFQLLRHEVIDVAKKDSKIILSLDNQQQFMFDTVVLGSNIPTYQTLLIDPEIKSNAYIENIWKTHSDDQLCQASPQTQVAIIGTGLTMVDAVIGLIKKGYAGSIIAISKHGALPGPHPEDPDEPVVLPFLKNPSLTLVQLLKFMRQAIAAGKKRGIGWQAYIDALRPYTTQIWENFSLADQKLFFRHIFNLWQKLRHRMPCESSELLQSLLKSGQLVIQKDSVKEIRQNGDKLKVIGNNAVEADYVINCAGPQMNIHKSSSLLLKKLLAQNLAIAHPLGLGLLVDDDYKVTTRAPIYVLGQLLIGQKLETVAVPELRQQADAIAKNIAKVWCLACDL